MEKNRPGTLNETGNWRHKKEGWKMSLWQFFEICHLICHLDISLYCLYPYLRWLWIAISNFLLLNPMPR